MKTDGPPARLLMAFNDHFRLSAHAVITNATGDGLLRKATYGAKGWGLSGGALEPCETIHACVQREYLEELDQAIELQALTGVYDHHAVNAQVFIFRARLPAPDAITLSDEHDDARDTALSALSPAQRAQDCLNDAGVAVSRKF